jgi:hypothetical protein
MSEIILSAVALFQQTSEAAGTWEWRQMGAGPVKKRWKQDAKGESAVATTLQWASEHFRISGDFFPVPSYGPNISELCNLIQDKVFYRTE